LEQVTNALLKAIEEATSVCTDDGAHFVSYRWIVEAHTQLAADMKLSDDDFKPVQAMLNDLHRLLEGVRLTQEVSPRLRARIASFGELLSSQLGLAYMRAQGLHIVRVDSRQLLRSESEGLDGVSEADAYLEADVRPSIQIEKANAAADGADVVICQGFIASTPSGATCLLGRGGSDTSGALFAALVGAIRCEIWTDVNGMFTADPRYVPTARLIRTLTYREAQELAAMGAKVLHPRCLLPAAFAGIPVEVRNTMDPTDDAEITIVSSGAAYATGGPACITSGLAGAGAIAESPTSKSRIVFTTGPWQRAASSDDLAKMDSPSSNCGGMFGPSSLLSDVQGPPKILAVARRKGVTLLTMSSFDMWGSSGFLARIFAPFASFGISVDLIACSQYAVSATLDHIPNGVYGEVFRKLLAALGRICTTTVRYPCAVVSIVGRSLRTALPRLGAAMKSLDGIPVHLMSEASEDLNLSFVVDEEHADSLVSKIHAELLESDGIAVDPQFGPAWTCLPCGKPAEAEKQ
jgi:aspartokinase